MRPPQRTSTYERPFTHKGNYLVKVLYWEELFEIATIDFEKAEVTTY